MTIPLLISSFRALIPSGWRYAWIRCGLAKSRRRCRRAGWGETSRVWLPGYGARSDGKPVELKTSQRGLAMATVAPGRHELELRYVGTPALWVALVASGLRWVGVVVGRVVRALR